MTGRLHEAFAVVDPDHGGPDCPAPERIWDAVHARLGPREVREVVEHVARCSSCAADWRSARAAGDPAPARSRAPRARWMLAAAAVLAGAAVLVTAPWREAPEPVYRDPGPAIRSLLPDGGTLARDRVVLRWSFPAADAVYSVVVGRPDLAPVASARDLRVPEYRVPPEALRGVEPGGTLVWRVEARLPDGRRIESPAFLLAVR